ncbi:MAG TPA: nicotinate (nicotinamide) nucleotide adenylyltransferase [Terriglobales bacterium]|nr:nicotinate (nicotinamide) nucleotide adenylyltransferase [Terriglobales bacterium]
MKKLGILGGTFDPIHRGHLAMAAAAGRACGLERIYFIPAERPWHRHPPDASFADRYAMVALALQGKRNWLPLAVPGKNPLRPTYALDQVRWIAARHREAQLHYVIGADAFATLPTWHQPSRLLKSCEWVVLARSGTSIQAVRAAAAGRAFHWIGDFAAPQSATAVRTGRTVALPATVRAYIQRAGLYAH